MLQCFRSGAAVCLKAQLSSGCKAPVQPGVATWVYIDTSVVVPPFTHLGLANFFFQQDEVPPVAQSQAGAGYWSSYCSVGCLFSGAS